MSIMDATVSEGPYKGFPLAAAIAIGEGKVTPREAKALLIEHYGDQKRAAIELCDAAIAETNSLPDSISLG
jgi:hypothetical protein